MNNTPIQCTDDCPEPVPFQTGREVPASQFQVSQQPPAAEYMEEDAEKTPAPAPRRGAAGGGEDVIRIPGQGGDIVAKNVIANLPQGATFALGQTNHVIIDQRRCGNLQQGSTAAYVHNKLNITGKTDRTVTCDEETQPRLLSAKRALLTVGSNSWWLPLMTVPLLLCGEMEEVSQAEPDIRHMDVVSKGLAGDWRRLGRRLGLADSRLDQIAMDSDRDGQYEKNHQMLLAWKRGSSGTTVQQLAQALVEIGRGDLADNLSRLG